MALIYWGEDAIAKCRELAGVTNPEEAESTSIRGAYGRITTSCLYENVIHVSANKVDAEREIKLWFQPDEIIVNLYKTKEIIKNNMFDENIKALEDYELYLRLKQNVKIRYTKNALVGHRHSCSLFAHAHTNFERGFWAKVIYDKHKDMRDLKDEEMLKSIHAENSFSFIRRVVTLFFKRPFPDAFFSFVTEISWRMGIVCSILTSSIKGNK